MAVNAGVPREVAMSIEAALGELTAPLSDQPQLPAEPDHADLPAAAEAGHPLAPGLSGRLWRFGSGLAAFESGPANSRGVVIFVPGLTDGLLGVPYVERLGEAAGRLGWRLIQPVLSSSWNGFGVSDLSSDAAELEQLIEELTQRRGADWVCLVGHSTGCQDAVQLMRQGSAATRGRVRAVVLQAPVSDREAGPLDPDWPELQLNLARAERMVAAGEPKGVVSCLYGAPISAERLVSLLGRDGLDDMFSSDLSDEQLRDRLGHMSGAGQRRLGGRHPGLKLGLAYSMGDEYVPGYVDKELLLGRLAAATGGERVALAGANHNLSKPDGAAEEFVQFVASLLAEVS